MAGGAGFYDITVGANLIVLVITFWPGQFFYFDDRHGVAMLSCLDHYADFERLILVDHESEVLWS